MILERSIRMAIKNTDPEITGFDWRGEPVKVGDMVVFPYAWGGQPVAMCEGEVLELHIRELVQVCKVDLHYDSGAYDRRRNWANVDLKRCTVVLTRKNS